MPEAPGDRVFDVMHLSPGDEDPGAGDLSLLDGDMIDTETMTINNGDKPLADGVMFHMRHHESFGDMELAVLRVRELTVADGAVVSVVGTRPLVIIAGGTAIIAGTLDASADKSDPGPGGYAEGMGVGLPGISDNVADSGGGGGSNFGRGGPGGDGRWDDYHATGGDSGMIYASPKMLMGGSQGGSSTPVCSRSRPAGAGGGAVQITAFAAIAIGNNGGINASGGGGGGGVECGTATSGAGGGSGGMIVLQAPKISHAGLLAANGGGGGGSGGTDGGGFRIYNGSDGQNGEFGLAAAGGGDGGGFVASNDGGKGGAMDAQAQKGRDDAKGNGGGGGGGVGYVLIATGADGLERVGGMESPAAELEILP